MTKESGYVLIGILKGSILYSLPTSFACFEPFREVEENGRVLSSAVLEQNAWHWVSESAFK